MTDNIISSLQITGKLVVWHENYSLNLNQSKSTDYQ